MRENAKAKTYFVHSKLINDYNNLGEGGVISYIVRKTKMIFLKKLSYENQNLTDVLLEIYIFFKNIVCFQFSKYNVHHNLASRL